MNNNEKLKRALAKMLPNEVHTRSSDVLYHGPYESPSLDGMLDLIPVKHAELLYLCLLAEKSLSDDEYEQFGNFLLLEAIKFDINKAQRMYLSATWQQRVTALAKVKGITIQ